MGPAEAHLELQSCSVGVLPAQGPLQRSGGFSSIHIRACGIVSRREVCNTHRVAQHGGEAFRENKPL